MLLSDPKFHYNNIKFIIYTLLNNNYPAKFVFNTINNHLKYWFKNFLVIIFFSNNNDTVSDHGHVSWFLLPLILCQRNFRRFVKTPT